jgi:two-component system chemotaxis sensor kinase CheA
MLNYEVFDSILDAVFVVDNQTKVIYCNDAAATLCQTSVRRLTDKVMLQYLLDFTESIFPFSESSPGWNEPSPFVETSYRVLKSGKTGKVQLSIHPIKDVAQWIFVAHDVTLEESLHSKYHAELRQKEVYIAEIEDARRKLEDYSKNLERTVAQRTSQLSSMNESLNAVLNSLGQGFLTFDSSGSCGDVYTRACVNVLEINPQGRQISEVLKVPENKLVEFAMWIKALFSEALPFDDLKPLGPSFVAHTKGHHIVLDYFPIRAEGKVREVVVVATDKTSEFKVMQQLEHERQQASMVVKFIKNKDQFLQFLLSTKHVLEQLENMSRKTLTHLQVQEALRMLHTLEGEAGTFSLWSVRIAARRAQTALEEFGHQPGVLPPHVLFFYQKQLHSVGDEFEAFLRENVDLIKMPKEGGARNIELDSDRLSEFNNLLVTHGIDLKVREKFENWFLSEPVEKRLNYYNDLAQNVAGNLGKKLKPLKIIGGDVMIRPEPYLSLFSSLVHVFRNAVDHGIEPPDERIWAEKDESGQIVVTFRETATGYELTIQDDGQGIDPSVIRKKLAKTHPQFNTSKQSDEEIIQNIFLPGFSSKDSIGEYSGRGVGMDAVWVEVVRLGGSVKVYSETGKGTKFVFEFQKARMELSSARSA